MWAHLFVTSGDLTLGEQSKLKGMLIFAPGDLKPIPLSELHLVAGPGIQNGLLSEHWNAAQAYCQRPAQNVDVRLSSGSPPVLDAFSMAAELQGDSADSSNLGLRHARDAQALSSDEEDGEACRNRQGASRDPRVFGLRQGAQHSEAVRLGLGTR